MDPATLKQFPGFGRRRSPKDDCKNVMEALVWAEPELPIPDFRQLTAYNIDKIRQSQQQRDDQMFGGTMNAVGRGRKTPLQVQQIAMQRSP